MRRARDETSGQASAEYVAVLALVAVVLAGALALATGGAPGVVNAVVGQIRHALCIVGGSACRTQALRPCVVASRRERDHLAANIVLVRLDDEHVLLRERLSDGTVRITVVQDTGAGVEVGLGTRARVHLGDRSVGVGANVRAAVLAGLGDGRVFTVASEAEARRLVRRLGRPSAVPVVDRVRRLLGGDGGGPRADETFVELGPRAVADGGAAAGPVTADFAGALRGALGARRNRRTGETTVYLRAGQHGGVLLSAVLGTAGETHGAAGVLALTFDRDRRPVELGLAASGELTGQAALSPRLAQLVASGGAAPAAPGGGGTPTGGARSTTAGARRWELDARADLTDPVTAQAFAAFRDDPASAAAVRALGAHLRDEAALDLRAYRTTSTRGGVEGSVALAAKIGLEVSQTIDEAQILAAASRPPGGLWERRADCAPGAPA